MQGLVRRLKGDVVGVVYRMSEGNARKEGDTCEAGKDVSCR